VAFAGHFLVRLEGGKRRAENALVHKMTRKQPAKPQFNRKLLRHFAVVSTTTVNMNKRQKKLTL
jgi:hypothetical protein